MTRIGFSYNQKPTARLETNGGTSGGSSAGFDVEPSFIRSNGARAGVAAVAAAPLAPASAPDDAYAEWDSPEAVFRILKFQGHQAVF